MAAIVLILFLIGSIGVASAVAYAKRCARLLRQLESEKYEKDELLRVRYQLEASVPKFITHTVLMDGISGSGKSSFIARLVSPVSTTLELQNMTATVSEYQSLDIPICWEAGEGTVLHSLRFFDVAGENSGTFIDALHTLSKERSGSNADVVLVIIWDISSQDKWAESVNHFNKQRIKATYGSKMASSIISAIIVFFNKIDLVDEQTASQRIQSAQNALNQHFENTFERGYGEIKYISGSVIKGTHMHDCLGAILQNFGLAPNFHKITGNASNPRKL
jgi:signal recognition particle receptor subunit beta